MQQQILRIPRQSAGLLALLVSLAGCSQTPPITSAKTTTRLVAAVVTVQPTKIPPPKPAGVPVVPKSLNFVQKGLHNCGTVAMLLSWTKLHPREAAKLVRRQNDGTFRVHFNGWNISRVTTVDLKAARRVEIVKCAPDDRWAEIVLTGFVKKLCQLQAPSDGRDYDELDFSRIEWISGTDIGQLLSNDSFEFFEIKPEKADAKGRLRVGPPVTNAVLERHLRAMRNRPATAYTNRRVHIWAVLDYDAVRKRVYARNPRRRRGEWMSLNEFRDRFQLLAYARSRQSGAV